MRKCLGFFGCLVAEGAGFVDLGGYCSILATTRRCSANGGNGISAFSN